MTFLTMPHSVFPRMRNVSGKSCRRNQSTHFVFNNVFRRSCRLRDNVEKYCGRGRQQMTILRLQIACWITKATYTFTICNIYFFSTEKKNAFKKAPWCCFICTFFDSFGFAQSLFLSLSRSYSDLFYLLIVGVEGCCCTARLTSMPPAGFEPVIPADERAQNYNLDRAAPGTGFS